MQFRISYSISLYIGRLNQSSDGSGTQNQIFGHLNLELFQFFKKDFTLGFLLHFFSIFFPDHRSHLEKSSKNL